LSSFERLVPTRRFLYLSAEKLWPINNDADAQSRRKAPRTARPGGGLTYAQGPHAICEKNSSF